MSDARARLLVPPEALFELPLFPLPDGVLLPHTYLSLHVFEPRYRRMMEDCAEGHRVLAVAMLDENGSPDRFGRPPIRSIAGVGVLRRSARLQDGRYNIVLEGVLRANIENELAPDRPYRRARAIVIDDDRLGDHRDLESAVTSVRSLCARVVAQMSESDADVMERLNEVSDPGALADLIAAATIQETIDRQKILEEANVLKRLNLAGASLAALLLKAEEDQPQKHHVGWGIAPGKA